MEYNLKSVPAHGCGSQSHTENICFQALVCYQLNTGFLILAAMLTFSCILEFSVLKSDLLVLLVWFTGFSLAETSLTCTMKSLYSLFIALWEESHVMHLKVFSHSSVFLSFSSSGWEGGLSHSVHPEQASSLLQGWHIEANTHSHLPPISIIS